jgi:hypothetical protein
METPTRDDDVSEAEVVPAQPSVRERALAMMEKQYAQGVCRAYLLDEFHLTQQEAGENVCAILAEQADTRPLAFIDWIMLSLIAQLHNWATEGGPGFTRFQFPSNPYLLRLNIAIVKRLTKEPKASKDFDNIFFYLTGRDVRHSYFMRLSKKKDELKGVVDWAERRLKSS